MIYSIFRGYKVCCNRLLAVGCWLLAGLYYCRKAAVFHARRAFLHSSLRKICQPTNPLAIRKTTPKRHISACLLLSEFWYIIIFILSNLYLLLLFYYQYFIVCYQISINILLKHYTLSVCYHIFINYYHCFCCKYLILCKPKKTKSRRLYVKSVIYTIFRGV